MKVDWNRKYTTISTYAFIVVCCSIVFYLATSQIGAFTSQISSTISILQPFIIGFVMAYLLNFILKFYENKLLSKEIFKGLKGKGKRGIGILLTYITTFFILYLFMQFVLPQLVDSVVGLVNDVPTYVNNATKFMDTIMGKLNVEDEYFKLAVDKWNEFIEYTIAFITNLIPILGNLVKDVASSVWNIILGTIVSIYLLIDKEKFYALGKKVTYGLCSKEIANLILKLTHRTNDTFGKFLSGKILDSAIIGVLTFVILTIFKMPYILLVSVIIGITNIIPFFGPFLGAIPAVIIILFVSPVKALWFLVIIVVIQQIDGNIIGPKILGDSIGIAPFWILFSVLVAGKVLGLVGMIIGVPLFAVIYSIIKDVIEYKLVNKNLPIDTSEYMDRYK